MAIGWLAMLQMVPWSDVIKNAPKVADGAKKLWSSVGKKSASPDQEPDEAASVQLTPEGKVIATLQAQVLSLETAAQDLHEQMLASSELIKALAEQNTQLIQRAEVNRLRLLLLAGVTAVLAVAAVFALTLVLAR